MKRRRRHGAYSGGFSMEMKQCANGHFYDQSKFKECPYCNSNSANIYERSSWNSAPPSDSGATQPVWNEDASEQTPSGLNDGERTAAVIKKEIGIDPVVGWLVCVEGKEKGRDYRIHADNNYIGRSERMDICIQGDDTISRENHAIISYDSRDRLYYFSQGNGRSIIRLNGKALFSTEQLKAYDIVEIGSTKLIFIPLCGEAFDWKQ